MGERDKNSINWEREGTGTARAWQIQGAFPGKQRWFQRGFSWKTRHSQGAFPGEHGIPKGLFLENVAFPRGFSWKTAVVPKGLFLENTPFQRVFPGNHGGSTFPKGFPWKPWRFRIPKGKENPAIPWNSAVQPGKAAGFAIPVAAFPEVLQHPGNGGAVPAAGNAPPSRLCSEKL